MPRPALHPDVVDLDIEIGQDAAEALKPAAQAFFVVALTTKRVGAGNAVMDIRRDCFHRLIPAMVVDVVEGLSDLLLHNVTVWHLISPRFVIALATAVASPTNARPSARDCTAAEGMRDPFHSSNRAPVEPGRVTPEHMPAGTDFMPVGAISSNAAGSCYLVGT